MDNYIFLDEYRQNGGEYIVPDGVLNTLLIDIENLQQENKKYKEVIDKAIETMESWYFALDYAERDRLKIIVDILKEVK